MPEIDKAMLKEFNANQLFKVDQIKIYPCMVMPYTEIEKWWPLIKGANIKVE